MRKLAGIAMAGILAATMAQAQETEVYSVNIVGFQKIQYPGGGQLELIANPFDGMLMREVAGNSGVHGAGSDVADNIIVYDGAEFTTYYLRSHSSIGYPEWRVGSTWATNIYLEPGQGFFYRSRSVGPQTHSIVGDVVMAGAITNTIREGLQLLAYPFSTRIKISDINLKDGVHGAGSDVADNLIVFDGAEYTTYYLRSHSSIGHPEWRVGSTWATNVYLEQGQAFWFRSRTVGTYDWVETNPYLGDL